MPFKKGQGGRKKGSLNKRTIWLLESLQEHGYDYEAMLTKFLKEGNVEMAELLIKLVPHIANAPKHDVSIDGVETLVINRYVKPEVEPES